MINPEISLYQRLGGEAAVRRLVDRFYDLMSSLPEAAAIRALHPETLDHSRDKLFMFLSGWLGGPQLYTEQFGHPRLRARHLPFAIGETERDAWMLCMRRALSEQGIDDPLVLAHLQHSLFNLANHMRNQ